MKAINALLTATQVLELSRTGPHKVSKRDTIQLHPIFFHYFLLLTRHNPIQYNLTVAVSVAIMFISFLGTALYIHCVRRLHVRLRWSILVAIGGFNEYTQSKNTPFSLSLSFLCAILINFFLRFRISWGLLCF